MLCQLFGSAWNLCLIKHKKNALNLLFPQNYQLITKLCIDFSVYSLLGTLLMEWICWWVPHQVRDEILRGCGAPHKTIQLINDFNETEKNIYIVEIKSVGIQMSVILTLFVL